jgi:hypothetical protein
VAHFLPACNPTLIGILDAIQGMIKQLRGFREKPYRKKGEGVGGGTGTEANGARGPAQSRSKDHGVGKGIGGRGGEV